MGGNYKASHLRKTTGQVLDLSGLARNIHKNFSRSRRRFDKGHRARGNSLHATSRQRVMNKIWAEGYGVFAHRNPLSPWSVGEMRLRFEERMARGLLFHAPPRTALVPPVDGPVGFFDGLTL